jgi:hypothetical protein
LGVGKLSLFESAGTGGINMKFDNELLLEMIASQRLKLSFWDKISHYWIVVLTFFGAIFCWYQVIKINITTLETTSPTLERSIKLGIGLLVISIVFFTIQYRRLIFKQVIIDCTNKQWRKAILKTTQELEWIIIEKCDSYICAVHNTRTYLNWGELITIIKIDNGILINSICDPAAKTALFSFGWNRKNRNTFIGNLKQIVLDK